MGRKSQTIEREKEYEQDRHFCDGCCGIRKTTFIKNMYFSDKKDTIVLNVYDYQQAAYKEDSPVKAVAITRAIRNRCDADIEKVEDVTTGLDQIE